MTRAACAAEASLHISSMFGFGDRKEQPSHADINPEKKPNNPPIDCDDVEKRIRNGALHI
jgi:hypothetical protein